MTSQATFIRTTNASERAFGRYAPLASGGMFMRHQMLCVPGCGDLADAAGIALDSETVTVRVRVSPKLYAGRISAIGFLAPANVASGTTYSATVDGTTYATSGHSTAQAVVEALQTAINAAAVNPEDSQTTTVLWGTETGQADGTWALIIWNEGDLTADPPVQPALACNLTHASSTGAWTARYMDAESCDFDIYEKHNTSGTVVAEPWGTMTGGSGEGLTKPWSEKFNLAGSSRVAVHISDVVATVDEGANMTTTAWAWVSPAIAEDA